MSIVAHFVSDSGSNYILRHIQVFEQTINRNDGFAILVGQISNGFGFLFYRTESLARLSAELNNHIIMLRNVAKVTVPDFIEFLKKPGIIPFHIHIIV